MSLIPATVLTGFLGAGKSTLLKHVLTATHGHRIAVIENEFGGADIDSEIIAGDGGEQIVQLSNGCICCTIRDDLRAALQTLADRRRDGEIVFDRVIIETTGLADPGPVAQTFFLDPAIAASYKPDGIVTLVDAKFGMRQLDERREARKQVGFADRVFITKGDLVPQAEAVSLSARIARMNPRAAQRQVQFGMVPLADVLDLGGFDLNDALTLDEHGGHQCHDDSCTHRAHAHDDVGSFVFRATDPLHGGRFAQFLDTIVRSHGQQLLRYKGVLSIAGVERKVIFQGVHQLTSSDLGAVWPPSTPRLSKLVFIGIGLPQNLILKSLQRCLVQGEPIPSK